MMIGVLAVTALTACSAVTPAVQRSTPHAAPSQTQTQSPIPDADAIVIRPDGLELVAHGTAIRMLAYTDAPADAVATLSALVAAQPVTTFHPSRDPRVSDSTTYEWAGFTITDDHLKQGGPGPAPHGPATFSIYASGPMIAGRLPVTTVQGFRAGDAVTAVAAKLGVDPKASVFFAVPAETGPVIGPSRVAGEKNAPAVLVGQASKDPTTIEIRAPYNFGDGHDV
ncbi:MAG TPA: hypothetical protein VN133_15800 [Humibacter sp.]|nr:hypothetical protein [Humibacter sp.]